MRGRFFHSFYAKLALALLVSFLAVAVGLLWLAERVTNDYQDEVRQKLHLDLAAQLAHGGDLVKDGEVDEEMLEQAFHNLMILGPDFEFYLLDREGRIVAYSAKPGKVKRTRVNMEPVMDLLSGKRTMPVRGDDPRALDRQKIFSAASFEDEDGVPWYLYVIIGGEIYDDIADLIRESHNLRLGGYIAIGGLAFCFMVILVIALLLTTPLRALSRDIDEFRSKGFAAGGLSGSRWDDSSPDELQRIGVAFRDMAHDLAEQYRNVKTTDEVRRELLSYISHDLRTPLASLRGYLETWEMKGEEMSAEERTRFLRVAIDNADRINTLVEQLFELAHLESAEVSVNVEPVAVAELAQDVLQQFQLRADEQGVALDVSPKDGSLLVIADIEKLERVLANLVGNAIRHCGEGDRVDIAIATRGPDHVRVEVADTGSGIDPEDLPHVFSAHFRGRNPRRGSGDHRGLGLAIAKRLLELHDTEIEVASEPGSGTRFWFTLPRASARIDDVRES